MTNKQNKEWYVEAIEDAVKEADSPGAIFMEHDEVVARIKEKWDIGNDRDEGRRKGVPGA